MTLLSTNPECPILHWYLVGEDQAGLSDQCRLALGLGLASVWVDERNGADPLLLAEWLALEHGGLRFTVVVRPGSLSPVSLVQQVNTVAAIIDGRIDVAFDTRGNDDDAAHHGRCEEFMDLCHELWRGSSPSSYEGTHYQVTCAELGTPFPGRTSPRLHLRGQPNQVPVDCIWHDEPEASHLTRGRFVPVYEASSVPDSVDEICLTGSGPADLTRLSSELQTTGGVP